MATRGKRPRHKQGTVELRRAALLMRGGNWEGALAHLEQAVLRRPKLDVRLQVGIARCQLKLGQYRLALRNARQAMRAAPQDWHAGMVAAQALRMSGQLPLAMRLLARLLKRHPEHAKLSHLLGDYLCKVLGDWPAAAAVWEPLRANPSMQRDMAWLGIKRGLYDLGPDPARLSESIRSFSEQYLESGPSQQADPPVEPAAQLVPDAAGVASRRPRIGLISTLWHAGPVYYLSIGALKQLAAEFDLVFFSRERLADWATAAFQEIASEWHEVKVLAPPELAALLRRSRLDAVVDLCGWLDMGVLKALAQRPVARQYKWVGGQSSTTGMHAFDGFVTDVHQTPPSCAHLYSEPLALMRGGYVTYTPPPYMPAARLGGEGAPAVGVISHPMKLSTPFLHYLRRELLRHELLGGPNIRLQFIGWRYGEPQLQQRLSAALGLDHQGRRGPVQVEFLAKRAHPEFLRTLAEVDWVLDTFPYTCGLTALEALALGVPLRTQPGAHFCSRHAYSHARFAGLEDEQILLEHLHAFGEPTLTKNGQSLLASGCARLDHERLAKSLARMFNGGRVLVNVPAKTSEPKITPRLAT